MFGFLGSLASALIPGVGPLIGLASQAVRAFSGGGGAGAAPVPLPPPPPPFDPRIGTVTPAMADIGTYYDSGGGAPFVGGDLVAPVATNGLTPSGMTFGDSAMQGAFDPISPTPTSSGFDLGGLIHDVSGAIGTIRTDIANVLTPRNVAVAGAGALAIGGAYLAARGAGSILSVLPKALLNTAIGQSVLSLYNGLRQRGMSHKQAKRTALNAHGIRLRRRRMRPTNVVALRRAIRRVRGARRIMSKVRALHVGGRSGRGAYVGRRRRRRGDLNPFYVEDRLDHMDEWEDEGGDADQFPDEEAV